MISFSAVKPVPPGRGRNFPLEIQKSRDLITPPGHENKEQQEGDLINTQDNKKVFFTFHKSVNIFYHYLLIKCNRVSITELNTFME